jgi:putative ABC transport system permease protein
MSGFRGGAYFRDIFEQALWALKDNRLRTILSILGIAVGITAVMAVGTVGKGGRHLIFNELETFGLKSVWIFRDFVEKDPRRAVRKGTGIDNGDYAAVDAGCCPAVRHVSPVIRDFTYRPSVRYGNQFAKSDLHGVNADYLAINNDNLSSGRPLRVEDEQRHRRVAIIGPEVERDLFGGSRSAVGSEIRIDDQKYLVVGVLAMKDRGFLESIGSAGGERTNSRVLIPYTTYQQMRGNDEVTFLQVETKGLDYTGAAIAQLKGVLKRRYGDQYAYKTISMEQYIETAGRILKGVSVIGAIAASVSLLVGGMAIMNIMSTSVLERTREIGLRKALGARRRDILLQILMEAVLISAIGGIAGIVLGLLASVGLALATGFPVIPSWWLLAVAFAVSISVGLLSGYYPAYRAASMQPVVALRYE